MTQQTPEALRARAMRRRHLQQRQTVIFGTLVAALLVLGVAAGAMWAGIIPSPFNVAINSGDNAPAVAEVTPPCPPAESVAAPYADISVNVLNGTDTSALAARTAAALNGRGVQIGNQDNGTEYGGVVRLTTGPSGVANAYTIAALFTESQIVIDGRDNDTVEVLVGYQFQTLVAEHDVATPPGAPLVAPEGCTPMEG